jgi:hypothetical protein
MKNERLVLAIGWFLLTVSTVGDIHISYAILHIFFMKLSAKRLKIPEISIFTTLLTFAEPILCQNQKSNRATRPNNIRPTS